MLRTCIPALALASLALPAFSQETPSPEGAQVYVIGPADGATLTNPVTIVFGLAGMGVAPAGADFENTGHHHLLINITPEEIALDEPLPATEQIVHFGGGQTQVTTELPPGEHTLRLLLGDMNHIPHDPPVVSEPITVTVE